MLSAFGFICDNSQKVVIMMDTFCLRNLIEAAQSQTLCDVVLKNARIVNVFTDQVLEGDISIYKGKIAGIGTTYKGLKEIDLEGKTVVPGFIDAHFHIESSMVTPAALGNVLLSQGVTTAICDPHEIVNVCGSKGMEFMLENARKSALDYYFMIPSSVPSCDFEVNGAGQFDVAQMEPFIGQDGVLGLAEVMRMDDILQGIPKMLEKVVRFKEAGLTIDGHAPMLSGAPLQAYRQAGIENDHEAATAAEAIERLQNGFTLFLREGSGAHNLEDLLSGLLNAHIPLSHCCLCTDDKHIEDILEEGTICWSVKKAVSLGCPPLEAIKMATLHPAMHYHLKTKGAIAPGFDADLVIVDNLREFKILNVFKNGQSVLLSADSLHSNHPDSSVLDQNGLEQNGLEQEYPNLVNTIHLPAFDERDLKKALVASPVIELVDNQLLTRSVDVADLSDEQKAQCNYVCAMERYGKTGEFACGLLKGFNLHHGALAASYAHDSHNIIGAGDNFKDLALSIHELEVIGGGYVLAEKGQVIFRLPLPIGGLMSHQDAQSVNQIAAQMKAKIRQMGIRPGVDPFTTLSFLSLPVIPEIRITPQGLYNVPMRYFTNSSGSDSSASNSSVLDTSVVYGPSGCQH